MKFETIRVDEVESATLETQLLRGPTGTQKVVDIAAQDAVSLLAHLNPAPVPGEGSGGWKPGLKLSLRLKEGNDFELFVDDSMTHWVVIGSGGPDRQVKPTFAAELKRVLKDT